VIFSAISLVSGRNINAAGLSLIKEFEGFRANFYGDAVGIRTIGYGHACQGTACDGIKAPLTQAEGEALLMKDLVRFEACVEADAPGLTDNQFSALVSFVFNLGCGTLSSSTLLKDLKAKDFAAAANQFDLFVHAGGQVLAGLVRRRAAEKALF